MRSLLDPSERQRKHTEEMENIITAPPIWLLRWGITLFLGILILIFGVSALIHYPDIVKAQLKLHSVTPPEPVISKISANLFRLLVKEKQNVKKDQQLAYLDNTADHGQILNLLAELHLLKKQLISGKIPAKDFSPPGNLRLGALQNFYQIFFMAYLGYKTSVNDVQATYKLTQALNTLIDKIESWKSNYVLCAPQAGTVAFATIIQENQVINAGQDLVYIIPGRQTHFFGEMTISQHNMGKIKEGQKVLIKLQSYPFEEYGMLVGRISRINDIPYKDSLYLSRVEITKAGFSNLKKTVHLKTGMNATAEIITEDASLLGRIYRNITKMIK